NRGAGSGNVEHGAGDEVEREIIGEADLELGDATAARALGVAARVFVGRPPILAPAAENVAEGDDALSRFALQRNGVVAGHEGPAELRLEHAREQQVGRAAREGPPGELLSAVDDR